MRQFLAGCILFYGIATAENPVTAQSKDSVRVATPDQAKKTLTIIDSLQLPDSSIVSAYDSLNIELDGLVVDETQTKLGRDFYDLFYGNWEAPITAKDYTIIITEKPLPQLGTQIIIRVHDTEIFQQFLQPRYDAIEEIAIYGTQVTSEFLLNYEQIKRDLGGEDLEGSGIY